MRAAIISDWWYGEEAVVKGIETLRRGATALDAVEEAIKVVEDDPRVDSVGTGAIPNAEGEIELDASIMDGATLRAGAVAALKRVRYPISVARKVMELTPHVFIVGEGAVKFARAVGFEDYEPRTMESLGRYRVLRRKLEDIASRSSDPKVVESWKMDFDRDLGFEMDSIKLSSCLQLMVEKGLVKHHETVGVVAVDRCGNFAAGTSTSGLAMKLPGRVGDSPIIGSGTYADNRSGGASATGVGEVIMRHCLAKEVCNLMESGASAQIACERAVRRILLSERNPYQVAVISLDRHGEPGAASTADRVQAGFTFPYAFMHEEMTKPLVENAPIISQ